MRRRFAFTTAVALCFALAFTPMLAAERGVDRQGDRSKGALDERTSAPTNIADTFGQHVQTVAQDSRLASGAAATEKAAALLANAGLKDGADAIATLQQIRSMGLTSSPENDKILAETNLRLGDLFQGTASKQVALYAQALQYADDPGMRERIESNITRLGGDVFAVSFNDGGQLTSRAPGSDDVCTGAEPAQPPHLETMNIDPAGDHNWRFIDNPGPDGWMVTIETISPVPGSFDYDTDLTLWSDCNAITGQGEGFLAFDEDCAPGGCNAPFMSKIEASLAPGTYYVEVGGFADISVVPDFDFSVVIDGTFFVPAPDSYEPDNDPTDDPLREGRDLVNGDNGYSVIGHPTSTPAHANGWGRAKKEIQSRTIAPSADADFAQFTLNRNELVTMATAGQFPTFFNDFSSSAVEDNPDTFLNLYYNIEYEYGGRCNEPDIGFANSCLTDQDCFDNCGGAWPCNGDPLAGFPVCIPYYFFNVPIDGNPTVGFVNALAANDDRDFGGGDLSSELQVCLPRTQPGSTSASVNGDWIVRIDAFSLTDIFEYELMVRNEVACVFEVEPNNSLTDTNALTLGDSVNGIFDFGVTLPFQDADVYEFNVDEDSLVTFETTAYDAFAADTAFELYAGPDDFGDFFLLLTDDDGGTGWLSRIDVILPPASALLGNEFADANYQLNVTSFFINPNYPYTLHSAVGAVPSAEAEPNDSKDTANIVNLGDTFLAELSADCDFDTYKLSVPANTFVRVQTGGAGDTAIEIEDAAGSLLACDDDGGAGLLSAAEGCLSPGDYYVTVRAFSGFADFSYDISFEGTAGCAPMDPPSMTGDNALGCGSFDTCP